MGIKTSRRRAEEIPKRIRNPNRNAAPVNVSLVGLGNWGTALARALFAAGIPLREIIVRTLREGDRRLAKQWKSQLVNLEEMPQAGNGGTAAIRKSAKRNFAKRNHAKLDAEIFWICTPDAAIAATAKELTRRFADQQRNLPVGARHRPPIVLHSSGALSSAALASLRKVGASLASVHPLMTVPHRRATSLLGVPFAIEGDAEAVRVARRLVRQLGGVPFSIRAQDKAMYHAFATFTSPLLTALLAAAQAAGQQSGLSKAEAKRRMRPIVERTVANFFAGGAAPILSGPVARGDVATVARHLEVLQANAALREIYRALQSFAVIALPGKNKVALQKALSQGQTTWDK